MNKNSRSTIQSKKRKTNIIYNTSIAIVFGLILIVGSIIFFGGNENQAASEDEEKTIAEQVQENNGVADEQDSNDNEEQQEESESASLTAAESQEQEDNASEDEQTEEQAAAVEEKEKKEKEEKKKKKDEKPEEGEFKPIGTEQTGEHVSSYEEGTVDWNEKVKAAAYATGLDASTMTVWWMGNNGGPNLSYADVSGPDASSEEYRVHLEWIDGEGWKPVKVDEL
ncbi:YrrS family protein [Jeotgalibacillus aurantiacus]|uniref:YrrS family protein n=1 Tax=Jeotgalibacillus aurantiacus TaxID=2763266 RepID=UPI001D0A16A4|nr:YrrS family protein [Jeotgalibacillus aurantiacus]